ncbi:MAG TPA: hypothetical protein ACFYEJ_06710 [Candidatus Wujingus californicus]
MCPLFLPGCDLRTISYRIMKVTPGPCVTPGPTSRIERPRAHISTTDGTGLHHTAATRASSEI